MSASIRLKELLYENTMPSAPELAVPEQGGRVRCLACGHRCSILPGRSGVCRVRFNAGGELRAPSGYVAGVQIDPIEKKPFYHAFPARDALSFGMLGCDLHCSYCQNWITSQALRDPAAGVSPLRISAAEIARLAVREGARVVASSYNEPLITAEWAHAVFREARARGLRTGFVSNGNATPEVLDYLRPVLDAYKIDLKTMDDRKYRSLGCPLKNILDGIQEVHRRGFWMEIVTLVVPDWNDSEEELRETARFIASISPDIPWHVTAFHPDYQMTDRDWTPARTLLRAAEIGKEEGLHFVYCGNLPGRVGEFEHTFCPSCGARVIARYGFRVLENRLQGGACPDCGHRIPGIWN